ncbi:response regulator [Butyrivibrio sp.]|uniref:response regulator n=1 Tax=Butyrivibrio sp. TaxID=28121 RepID=UPI0025C2FA7E|nr:response regulator [Butyrivibrio sp.]MBE5837533.1 response regulator [Butyrivibrio sp.]MBE5843199.1 response regulator [Butyrivibrio sp.]
MDNYKILGTNIRFFREREKLTQNELGEKLFVSGRCVGYWEKGQRKPDIDTLRRIADILNCDFDELINHSSDEESRPKVILVEDEKTILKCFMKLLKETLPGANVTGFDNPGTALRYAAKTKIAIAFLDIKLYGSSGIDLAKNLVEISPDLNIIFLTGYPEYAKDALDIFCSGYVLKPLTRKKILEQVEHLRYPIKMNNILAPDSKEIYP